jgi:hypothetical protein
MLCNCNETLHCLKQHSFPCAPSICVLLKICSYCFHMVLLVVLCFGSMVLNLLRFISMYLFFYDTNFLYSHFGIFCNVMLNNVVEL